MLASGLQSICDGSRGSGSKQFATDKGGLTGCGCAIPTKSGNFARILDKNVVSIPGGPLRKPACDGPTLTPIRSCNYRPLRVFLAPADPHQPRARFLPQLQDDRHDEPDVRECVQPNCADPHALGACSHAQCKPGVCQRRKELHNRIAVSAACERPLVCFRRRNTNPIQKNDP